MLSRNTLSRSIVLLLAAAQALLSASNTHAQIAKHNAANATSAEAYTSKAFEAAKKQGAPELYAFLKPMPKGADLHMHLSGAVYAETFIAEGARLGLCIAAVNMATPPVPLAQGAVHFVQPGKTRDNGCPSDAVPASEALQSQPLYDNLIDSFSMRAYVPTPSISGHDQFFSTFSRFDVFSGTWGEWLDEVASRAAAQNEEYLEIMSTPPAKNAYAAAAKSSWPDGLNDSNYRAKLASLRDSLFSAGLREDVAIDRKAFHDAEAQRSAIEGCNTSFETNAQGIIKTQVLLASGPALDHGLSRGGCGVQIHWLYQVLRGFPPMHVFAQTLLAFEVASVDPDVVGLNFVMPEDGRISMQDYHLQMLMLDYLHSVYPQVHISLHAGELAPGMVPPAGLSFHIREAVDLGHAERIGHGVDVLYEDDPADLLKKMAEKHVMVEINLTSNDVILGVKGTDSPFAAYRAAHVPTALSTDDEGVSRIDLTHEYVKAALEQNLSYADLKASARTSLEHAFLHGESLWSTPDNFAARKAVCGAPVAKNSTPTPACANFLQANERAKLQWQLEQRFAEFESAAR